MEAKYDDIVPISLFANQELLDRHNDRLAVFDAGTEVAQMQQIVRAVNTFDQAREALEYYAGTAIGARAVAVLEKIAAMESTHT